jgi:hypothetical protein
MMQIDFKFDYFYTNNVSIMDPSFDYRISSIISGPF